MLRNRQEGLKTLQGIWVTILLSGFFVGYVEVIRTTGLIQLIDHANYNLYFLGVFGGTLATLRNYQLWCQKLGNLSWIETLHLTKQQMIKLALVLFAVVFVTKDQSVSRLLLGSFLAFAAVILFFCNYYLPGLICRFVFKESTVSTLFIGSSVETNRLGKWIAKKANLGVKAVGLLTDEADPAPSKIPHLGGTSRLEAIMEEYAVGQVILLQNYVSREQTERIIAATQKWGCRLRIYNNLEREYSHPIVVDHDGEYTFFTLDDEPLENPVNRSIKRCLDLAIAIPVVAFLLPPLTLLVWFFQRRQAPGPIFYTQPRSGITKKAFNIIKFRTMYDTPDNAAQVARQATQTDQRIFPFGRFMRKTSIDEIPQFINVLLGDMSVAGPRPHLTKHDQEFSLLLKTYYTRHFVKPGITGLAQCKGLRGEISEVQRLEERIRYDLLYINKWSILLDIQIIFSTIKQIFFPPKSAY